MSKYVGDRTLELISKEKTRYEQVVNLLEKRTAKNSIEGNLIDLVNLARCEYSSTIDLKESTFYLKSYQIDEGAYLYDYMVYFAGNRVRVDDYYRGIVLTSLNLQSLWDRVYKIDYGFKVDNLVFHPNIGRNQLTNLIIEKTFSDSTCYGSPYIVYGLTNAGLGSAYKYESETRKFVEYHAKTGQEICDMIISSPEECAVITSDGVYGRRYVEPWVTNNFRSGDDPTKLIEMAGFYKSSEQLYDLVKRI